MRKSLRLLSEFIRLRSALVFLNKQDGGRGRKAQLDFAATIVEVSDTMFCHMCWDEEWGKPRPSGETGNQILYTDRKVAG